MNRSLSVIMPAYNEAGGIKEAYESTTRAVKEAKIDDYEILIVTNNSSSGTHDGTPDIAESISKKDEHVRHIYHNNYVDLGFKYRDAISKASKDYVMMVPGDNDTVESSLVNILKHVGESSLIVVYTSNPKARPFYIRTVSKAFVVICNFLFGLKMKYYNGMCVLPKATLRQIPMSANNPAYMAEILIYLVKSGVKYIEIPQEIKYTPHPGKTFNFNSVITVIGTMASLFWKVHLKRIRVKLNND